MKNTFAITGFTIYDLDCKTKDTIGIMHVCLSPENVFVNNDKTITINLNINDDKKIINKLTNTAFYIFDFAQNKKYCLDSKEICECINTIYFNFIAAKDE